MDSLFKNLQRNTIKRIENGEFITGDAHLLDEELSRYRGDWMENDESDITDKKVETRYKEPVIPVKHTASQPEKDKIEIDVTEYNLFDRLRNMKPSDYKNMTVLLLELYFMGELDRINVLKVPNETLVNIQKTIKEFPEMLNAILKGE